MSDVGYIGLGIMGRPAASNLIKAGHHLTVATRTQSRATPLVEAGATLVNRPAELAAATDVIFLNLPDTPDVEIVLFGDGGVVEAEDFKGLIIDMSTIDPTATVEFAERLNDRGIRFVDAPVSGGEAGATAGTLSVMAGGSNEAFAEALPYLRIIGERITHVGPSGGGQVAKACNQLLVASNVRAVAEAIVLAERSGLIDPAVMREAVTGGFADSKVLQHHGLNMLEGRFDPGFKAELHAKDARIVSALAANSNAPIEAFEVAHESLDRLVESDRGDLDNAAIVQLLREQADANSGQETSES